MTSGGRRTLRRMVVALSGAALLAASSLPSTSAAPARAAAPPPVGTAPTAPSEATGQGAAPTSWRLDGSGFGHGVGMSQYGARYLAGRGWSARAILARYYAGTTYDAVPDRQTIAVNLEQGASRVDLVGLATATSGGTVTVRTPTRQVRASAGRQVRVTRTTAGVVASCSACGWSVSGSRLLVDVYEARTDLQVGGHRYRYGQLVVTPGTGGGVDAVLHMRLHDEYLDQIREVPWSWPRAALEAQAAAARAYALRKVSAGLRSECACHVLDTVGDQVFHEVPTGGDLSGWPQWRAAVRATGSSSTGYVPRYQGQIIEALYSSSNGGWSQASEDVFGTAQPYLRSRYDTASLTSLNPYRSWSRTVSGASLASAFGLPDVVSLDLSSRTSGHGVATAEATSSSGRTARIAGTDLRRRLGLPSTVLRRGEARTAGDYAPELAATFARRTSSSATSVVITGMYPEDALHTLIGQPLAGTLGAPLLLSGRGSLPSASRSELARRGSTLRRAYVLGGTAVISDAVVRDLRARGLSVTRLGGSSTDSVAAAVLDEIAARRTVSRVAVTSARGAPAAAAFAGPARRVREPVVVAGTTDIPYRSRAAMDRAGVGRVHLLGSSSLVTGTVQQAVRSRGISTHRVYGADEQALAGNIGRTFASSVGGSEVVLVPGGASRALHRSIAGGHEDVELIGAARLPSGTAEALQRTPAWVSVRAVGDGDVVPSSWLWAAREA